MTIDLTGGGRGNKSPDQEVQVINNEAVNDELRADTTAVVTFILDKDYALAVDDVFANIDRYMCDTKTYFKEHSNGKRMAADFRKIFWCVQLSRWKAIIFILIRVG